jgi:hypothetical protein
MAKYGEVLITVLKSEKFGKLISYARQKKSVFGSTLAKQRRNDWELIQLVKVRGADFVELHWFGAVGSQQKEEYLQPTSFSESQNLRH